MDNELINVSAEGLREKATLITKKVEEIKTILTNVTTEINSLPDSFEGKASSAFQEKYQEFQQVYDDFSGEIQKCAKFLNMTADTYEQTDEEIANIFKKD